MSRTRELYMDIEVMGRTFCFEDEVLTLESDEEPEILEAYFAEKKIEYVDEAAGTHTYTFASTNNTSTDAKKDKIATIILKKVNSDVKKDKKHTILANVRTQLTADTYASGSTITIDLLKNVEKISYPKLSKAPMGYQVYLITETRNLKDKKAKIKIHEKEDGLKLLKTKDDILPVLVFAKKEDTTTDTEATDWIEIDVKEENGKKEGGAIVLHQENKGDTIEVGIKKIQLRPKEDKIKAEGEDATKSFEGWQEVLYIRDNETEEGKKAIADAEEKTTARAAEAFLTLTKDDSTAKLSYPKKISGTKTVTVGEEAVYIIDKYTSANATTADKHNIQWTLYVQGEDKTTYTTITTKSKDKLYTYAKTELVDVVTTTIDGVVVKTGGKNKLTIVFADELKGKKVQIEPFRGSPGINNKKDYVKTTTVQEVPAPKIAKRETTQLWLQSQCDSVENAGEMVDKEFKGYFELITPDTIHIYHDGKISKLNFDALDKVKYRYHDDAGEAYDIGIHDIFEAQKWKKGSKYYNNGWKKITTTDNDGSTINRYYEYDSGKIKLVKFKLPILFKKKNLKIKLNDNSSREYINPEAYACLLGAIAENDFPDLTLNGFTSKDGTGAPSVSHYNGIAGDFRYLRKDEKLKSLHINTSPDELDVDRQDKFIDGLIKFGWNSFLSYDIVLNGSPFRLDHTTHKSNHHHHLHLNKEDFIPKYK